MNDSKLQAEVFPKLAQTLLEEKEVWVDIDYISQFSHYLRQHHEKVWLQTEQEPSMNDDWKTRFYVRSYEPGHNG